MLLHFTIKTIKSWTYRSHFTAKCIKQFVYIYLTTSTIRIYKYFLDDIYEFLKLMFLHEKAFERSGRQLASKYISFHYIVFIQHLKNIIVFHFDLIPDKKNSKSYTGYRDSAYYISFCQTDLYYIEILKLSIYKSASSLPSKICLMSIKLI